MCLFDRSTTWEGCGCVIPPRVIQPCDRAVQRNKLCNTRSHPKTSTDICNECKGVLKRCGSVGEALNIFGHDKLAYITNTLQEYHKKLLLENFARRHVFPDPYQNWLVKGYQEALREREALSEREGGRKVVCTNVQAIIQGGRWVP